MKINDRVKHKKYGIGTIRNILFENTKREHFSVEFDVPNDDLHSCFETVKDHCGYFCNKNELEVIWWYI